MVAFVTDWIDAGGVPEIPIDEILSVVSVGPNTVLVLFGKLHPLPDGGSEYHLSGIGRCDLNRLPEMQSNVAAATAAIQTSTLLSRSSVPRRVGVN